MDFAALKKMGKDAMCARAPPPCCPAPCPLPPPGSALSPPSRQLSRARGAECRVKVTGTELEKKIADACSNKPWGASSTMLSEIAQATYDYHEYPVVMSNVWKRVHERGSRPPPPARPTSPHPTRRPPRAPAVPRPRARAFTLTPPRSSAWRIVYKALSLLDYLIKNGSERAVEDARDHTYQIRTLCDFTFTEAGVDQGINVREKSRQILELLDDRDRLRDEREKVRSDGCSDGRSDGRRDGRSDGRRDGRRDGGSPCTTLAGAFQPRQVRRRLCPEDAGVRRRRRRRRRLEIWRILSG